MENLKSVWDFVERYYPNYYLSSDILYNEDLQKITDREINGTAKEIYDDLIIKGMSHYAIIDWAENELHISNAYIFEKAIQGFIDQQNN